MILACVNLPQESADSWSVPPQNYKQVFNHETHRGQFVDELDVSEALLIGADLVLALYDIESFGPQHPIRFTRSTKVQIKNGFMVFLRIVFRSVVAVVVLKILVVLVRGAAWCMHVRGIKHNAVDRRVAVRQFAAVHA
jgi:hypothetical protein